MSQNVEIESADVIRLILQFLAESNLPRTVQMLQEESGVCLNSVESVDKFVRDVHHGRWDEVLRVTATTSLSEETQQQLYEQVFYEMLELRETELARLLLRETAVLQQLRQQNPEHFKRLDTLANPLALGLDCVPSSRLLSLIGMALNYQKHKGILPPTSEFNLYSNATRRPKEAKELYPQDVAKSIRFTNKSHPECAAFSPDGRYLASGSIDGFIEIWDWQLGALNKDLKYQREGLREKGSLATVSEDAREGSQTGQLKVWLVATGQCIKKIDKAHDAAIASITFSKDNTHILTGSFDTTARIHGLKAGKPLKECRIWGYLGIHGLKAGKTLKEFRGHLTFVNCALYLPDNTRIITGSADGKIKIWDSKTQDCLQTFTPPVPAHMQTAQCLPSVMSIILAPRVRVFINRERGCGFDVRLHEE
ncbi:WD-40 repeat protein, putative [Eimeria acervulina]|uniref:WD-40 repeat protein, putative n=1 Tax=Eimeria acervulina TaxID=5801 RepID=U6GVQ1_EIMAC|nr:WD-40 repeat protein, putative [Eimeria acervulina]CDI84336.1 WD-40 repeat protein, putative [Eimeria acervulina]